MSGHICQSESSDATPIRNWSIADCFSDFPLPAKSFIHRNYSLGMHTHDFVEINLVLGGEGWHFLPGAKFPLKKGDAFVIPPAMCHGYHSTQKLDVRHILVHPDFLTRHAPRLLSLTGYLMFFTVEPFLREESDFRYRLRLETQAFRKAELILSEIENEGKNMDNASTVVCEGLCLELIAFLCRWYSATNSVSTKKPADRMQAIQAVFSLIDKNFATKLTLDELAKTAHLQRNHFCRVFREATGMTPLEYVNRIRINKALILLATSGLTISEIGLAIGFYDTAHFSRSFRVMTGQTPSAYREKMCASAI